MSQWKGKPYHTAPTNIPGVVLIKPVMRVITIPPITARIMVLVPEFNYPACLCVFSDSYLEPTVLA